MVLAISFLETPLKFRAPGITVPLGLGIGRLVFRALNTVEVVLAAALITALLTITPGAAGWTLLVVTVALLATQAVLLRPRLDRRAQKIITGHPPPPSRLHLTYIGLECLKVATLIALAALLATIVNAMGRKVAAAAQHPGKIGREAT